MPSKKTSAKKRAPTKTSAKKKAVPMRGAPTIADLRRIARSIVTSTSVRDEKRMLAHYADNVESEEVHAGSHPIHGIEALKTKVENWNKRVSDSRWHACNLWCDGQTVIIEWQAQLALKPGGKKVFHRELAVHEIRNGQIVRERFYYDPTSLG